MSQNPNKDGWLLTFENVKVDVGRRICEWLFCASLCGDVVPEWVASPPFGAALEHGPVARINNPHELIHAGC